VNATTDLGLPPRLLNVVVHRLDAVHLARLSRHFGFAAVYAAVAAEVPAKMEAFTRLANVDDAGPRPGDQRFGPNGKFAPPRRGDVATWHEYEAAPRARDGMLMNAAWRTNGRSSGVRAIKVAGFGQFLNMTPYEIYLDFRTAPVGALAVNGALYETSTVLSSTLLPAYGTGYAIGTYVVGPLIETYSPSLYDAIGGTIAQIVENLSVTWSESATASGVAERTNAPSFQATSTQYYDFACYAGDYSSMIDWASLA
jgi:hypothetical protein